LSQSKYIGSTSRKAPIAVSCAVLMRSAVTKRLRHSITSSHHFIAGLQHDGIGPLPVAAAVNLLVLHPCSLTFESLRQSVNDVAQ
jgi:hypothetical protein